MPLASLCLLGTLSHLSDGALMDRRTAEVASGPGNRWFLAAGLSLPLLEGRPREARETIEGFVLTAAATQLLKHWTRSRRPDGSDHLSFPSGHTSAAFSLAASRSAQRPGESALWYAGAATIGASRVVLNRHRIEDVLAGAAIGIGFGSAAAGARLLRISVRF